LLLVLNIFVDADGAIFSESSKKNEAHSCKSITLLKRRAHPNILNQLIKVMDVCENEGIK
jgi:hypothetical protein